MPGAMIPTAASIISATLPALAQPKRLHPDKTFRQLAAGESPFSQTLQRLALQRLGVAPSHLIPLKHPLFLKTHKKKGKAVK
jgi:hypothetical protein